MRTTALVMAIIAFAAAVAQMLPGDGAKVTVNALDAEINESPDSHFASADSALGALLAASPRHSDRHMQVRGSRVRLLHPPPPSPNRGRVAVKQTTALAP